MTQLEEKFLAALKSAQAGKLEEARAAFEAVVAADPKGDLADDALYNLGYLHFRKNEFDKAETVFKRLIAEYPEATIAEFPGSTEHGKTAAKAWYMLLNCALAMGKHKDGYTILDQLDKYPDTYVAFVDGRGVQFRKGYRILGQELLDKYAVASRELEQVR